MEIRSWSSLGNVGGLNVLSLQLFHLRPLYFFFFLISYTTVFGIFEFILGIRSESENFVSVCLTFSLSLFCFFISFRSLHLKRYLCFRLKSSIVSDIFYLHIIITTKKKELCSPFLLKYNAAGVWYKQFKALKNIKWLKTLTLSVTVAVQRYSRVSSNLISGWKSQFYNLSFLSFKNITQTFLRQKQDASRNNLLVFWSS